MAKSGRARLHHLPRLPAALPVRVRVGIHAFHGHRHLYAQERYKQLTGWECPAHGGPTAKQLTPQQKA
jgi:hypothetical protein